MTTPMARLVAEGQMAFDAPFVAWGDGRRRVTRFTCAECGATHDTPIATSEFPPAEFVLKRPRRDGWQVNETKRAAIRCAECAKGRRTDRQASPTTTTEPEQPAQAHQEEHEAPMTVSAAAKPPKPAVDPAPREPTYDERMRIHRILEECFDDKAGQWLDGLDDKAAGERINVPWSLVTRIREAAYGPIRVDPELQAIRQEAAAILAEHVKLAECITALAHRLTALDKRIEGRRT